MDNWTGTFSSRRSPGLSLGTQHQLFSTGTKLHKSKTLKDKLQQQKVLEAKQAEKTAATAAQPPVEEASASSSSASDTSPESVKEERPRVSLRLDQHTPGAVSLGKKEAEPKPSSQATSTPSDESKNIQKDQEPPAKKIKRSDNGETSSAVKGKAEEEDKGKESVGKQERAPERSDKDAAKGKKQDKAKPKEKGRKVRFGADTKASDTHKGSAVAEPTKGGEKVSDLAK